LFELRNNQVLFILFIGIYPSDEFVGFYYLLAVELHLLITRAGTCEALLSRRYWIIPLQLSSCTCWSER